jgi:hypothetical protein
MSAMHAEAVGGDLDLAARCILSLFTSNHEDEDRVPTMVGAALVAEACLRLRSLQS